MKRRGRKSASQTPAPKSERISGSKVNKPKSATSEKSSSITLSEKTMNVLRDKIKEFKKKHPSKKNIDINDAKAVYRRGAGAYSSTHRPTISGGKPNTRNAWAMARVNKFLKKAGGEKVKKAYVQDDDLMKYEGGGATINEERKVFYERTYADGTTQKFSVDDYEKNVLPNLGKWNEIYLAPNGNQSNLTPEQYKLVRTPEFKAWFGDWENDPENASKIVDDNGEPLVCYHGSRSKNKFYTFQQIFDEKLDWTKDSYGYYFAVDKDYAKGYGETIYECFLNIRKPKISNGFEHTYTPLSKFENYKFQGYDGIYFLGDVDESKITYEKEIVAFEPNQIKLADGTNTTFDGSNPDIRYEKGGEITDENIKKLADNFKPDMYMGSYLAIYENFPFEYNENIGNFTIHRTEEFSFIEKEKIQNFYESVKRKKPYDKILIGLDIEGNKIIFKIKPKNFEMGGKLEDEKKKIFTKWKHLVNMSKSELETFYNSKEGKEAGLSPTEAKEQGIDSGRESARWIMRMKDTPVKEWTPNMWKWAKKQISFISRMSGNKGKLYDENGVKTRKHTSLLIWGHNPEK